MEPSASRVYFSRQLTITKIFGIWPYDEDAAQWKKVSSTFIFYSFLIIKLVTMSALLYHFYRDRGHLREPIEDALILTSDFNTIIGMVYIPIKMKSFHKIMKYADDHFIVPSKDSDEVYHNIYRKYLNAAYFTGNLFISSGVATVALYYFIPFISEKVDGNRRLPYEAAFPFDTTSGVNYWIAYVILTTSMMTKGINGTITCDFIVSLIIQTTCQFCYLQQKILNIREDIIKSKAKSQQSQNKIHYAVAKTSDTVLSDIDDSKVPEITEEEINEEMVEKLNECIKYHQALLT